MHKTIEDLKDSPRWLLWRKRMRGDKVAKIPFAADGSPCGTNEEYQDAWVTYEKRQIYTRRMGLDL